jgi:hypothetical protein
VRFQQYWLRLSSKGRLPGSHGSQPKSVFVSDRMSRATLTEVASTRPLLSSCSRWTCTIWPWGFPCRTSLSKRRTATCLYTLQYCLDLPPSRNHEHSSCFTRDGTGGGCQDRRMATSALHTNVARFAIRWMELAVDSFKEALSIEHKCQRRAILRCARTLNEISGHGVLCGYLHTGS